MYMCVVLVYFLSLRISIFEKKNRGDNKHRYVSTKHHVRNAERAETKSGNAAIRYSRIIP